MKNIVACHGKLCALRLVQFHHAHFFLVCSKCCSIWFVMVPSVPPTLVHSCSYFFHPCSLKFTLVQTTVHWSSLKLSTVHSWSIFFPVVHSSSPLFPFSQSCSFWFTQDPCNSPVFTVVHSSSLWFTLVHSRSLRFTLA